MKSLVDNKILGFDMDGVIVDNNPIKMEILRKWGYRLKPTDMSAEALKKLLTPEDFGALQIALYRNLGMSLSAKLMPGIGGLLEKISASGTPYFLISRRSAPEIAVNLLKSKELWPKYFNETNAYFVIEPVEKNITAKKLGITHYVDDESRILSVLDDVPNKFLFDPMNVFPEGNYIKVSSHEELARHFL